MASQSSSSQEQALLQQAAADYKRNAEQPGVAKQSLAQLNRNLRFTACVPAQAEGPDRESSIG